MGLGVGGCKEFFDLRFFFVVLFEYRGVVIIVFMVFNFVEMKRVLVFMFFISLIFEVFYVDIVYYV